MLISASKDSTLKIWNIKTKKIKFDLPGHWDDVHFIDGFPGKYIIVARKSGAKWYIAGIHGEASEKNWEIDLSFLKQKNIRLIGEGNNEQLFSQQSVTIPSNGKLKLIIKSYGGFVAVAD